MAFQSNSSLSDFLRRTAASASVAEAAPATNFLLEERLADQRETAFVHEGPSGSNAAWDNDAFRSAYGNHFSRNVGVNRIRRRECQTFATANQPALFTPESHRDVVRLESISGLYDLNKSVFFSAAELAVALRSLAEKGVAALDANDRDRLQIWLDGVNTARDCRPMFVAPWGEVESLLRETSWPGRLRDAMGLVHLGGTATAPFPVVLMRYNLSRSESAATSARLAAWAATPTVLEAGTHREPNPAFFPFPPAAVSPDAIGFGQTVDLGGGDGLNYKQEFVHFCIDYELADFHRVGDITDSIDDPQLAAARDRHLNLLENDLRHRADVP